MTLRTLALAASLVALVPLAQATAAPATRPAGLIAYSAQSEDGWRLWTVRPDGTGARPLGIVDHALDAAWSPDGRRIALSGRDPRVFLGDNQILVMNADGTGLRRITTRRGIKRSPSWSPDGRSLVFAAYVRTPGAAAATCELRVVDLASGAERTVLALGAVAVPDLVGVGGGCGAFPEWSPRGDLIAFSDNTGDGGSSTSVFVPFVVRPDGSGLRRLAATGFAPTWSPDGSRLAFGDVRSLPGGFELHTIAVDGSDQRTVARFGVEAAFPAYAPDGRSIVVQAAADGEEHVQIYRVPVGGGSPVRLTSSPHHNVIPAWTGHRRR